MTAPSLLRPHRAGHAKDVSSRVGSRSIWIAFAVYAIVALAANWPAFPGDPDRTRIVVGSFFHNPGSTDTDFYTWMLAWIPHALTHLVNPFYTNQLNFPDGINLAENTSAPLLGLLGAPLTLAVNAVSTMNLLLWLAFPLSAISMFVVLRRFIASEVAAFIGGALYGFSPYIIDQSLDHLSLCFVPLPPLIFLAAYELLRPGQERVRRWGAALGLLVVAQFLISPEICATSLMMLALAIVALVIKGPSTAWAAVRRTKYGIAVASVMCVVLLAYPIDVMFSGPYHFSGPPFTPGAYPSDLLSAVIPTTLERLSLGHLGVIGSRLIGGDFGENGGYLGVPLIALLGLVVVRYRRRPWIRFAALMGVVAWILSLGNHLVVDGRITSFPLPFDLVGHLPLFEDILQNRLALFVMMFVSFAVAIGLDEFLGELKRVNRDDPRPSSSAMTTFLRPAPLAITVLGALAVVTLVPRFPLHTETAGVPSYFSTDAVDAIPANSVVLVSPFPAVFDTQPMLWQAVAGDRFKILGGYGQFSGGPSDGNRVTELPPVLAPSDVETYLIAEGDGYNFPNSKAPVLNANLACDLRTFLLAHDIGTIIAGPTPSFLNANPEAIQSLFRMALGPASATDGAVTVWYDVGNLIVGSGLQCQ